MCIMHQIADKAGVKMIDDFRKLARLYRMSGRQDLADKVLILIAKETDGVTPKSDLSYSAIMRDLHKDDTDKMLVFMKAFKEAFDEAYIEGEDDPDKTALMQARGEADYEL